MTSLPALGEMFSLSNATPRKFHGEVWRNCGHEYHGSQSRLKDRHILCLTQQKFPRPALTSVKVSIAVPRNYCQVMPSSRALINVPTMLLYQASCACAKSFLFAGFVYIDALKCIDPSVQHVQPDQSSPRRIVAWCRTQDE